MMQQLWNEFVTGLFQTSFLEFIAVIFGVASVLFSRAENILVYPTGLINTILYTYFCFAWWDLYAEGSLNFYYTAMSIYGWWAWTRKKQGYTLAISYNNAKDWVLALLFFLLSFVALYLVLKNYTNSTVPFADSLASAAAYTGMWQMTRKKVENWMWWVLTNALSIPLYFYKGAVFTSVQYIIFLVLALMGWWSWVKKSKHGKN